MTFVDYENDLRSTALTDQQVLDRHYNSGGPAVFQGAEPAAEAKLKDTVLEALADEFGIRLHQLQLIICGSAHLGFRPVPGEGYGRPFNPKTSDLDIAVISPELFDTCWAELQAAGVEIDERFQIARDLFLGFINPDHIRTACEFGREWWSVFGHISTDRATGIRGRLYRTHTSMDNYHRQAIHDARSQLLTKTPLAADPPAHEETDSDYPEGFWDEFVEELRRAENALPWVGLKHFRDNWLPDLFAKHHVTDSDREREHAIRQALDRGLAEKHAVENPNFPDFPTAAIRVSD